jgi:hypothetical protein
MPAAEAAGSSLEGGQLKRFTRPLTLIIDGLNVTLYFSFFVLVTVGIQSQVFISSTLLTLSNNDKINRRKLFVKN